MLRLWKFSDFCSRHTVGGLGDDIMFHILVLEIDLNGKYKAIYTFILYTSMVNKNDRIIHHCVTVLAYCHLWSVSLNINVSFKFELSVKITFHGMCYFSCIYTETERSSGWLPFLLLEMLKESFVSSDNQGSHSDDLFSSVYVFVFVGLLCCDSSFCIFWNPNIMWVLCRIHSQTFPCHGIFTKYSTSVSFWSNQFHPICQLQTIITRHFT